MFKYNIIKKGPQYYEGLTVDENKLKAFIEVNEYSKDWEVGTVVKFEGTMEQKAAGDYVQLVITPTKPRTKEDIKQFNEIKKWMELVRNNAQKGFVYWKGIDVLRKLPITDKQKNEIDTIIKQVQAKQIKTLMGDVRRLAPQGLYKDAVEKLSKLPLTAEQKAELNMLINRGTRSTLEKRLKDYFGYMNDYLAKGKWYDNGEKAITDMIQKLQDIGVQPTSFINQLHVIKNKYRNMQEEEQDYLFTKLYLVKDEGTGYKKGEILVSSDGRLGKVINSTTYFENNARALGLKIDSGWVAKAICDTREVRMGERDAYCAKNNLNSMGTLNKERQYVTHGKINRLLRDITEYVQNKGVHPVKSDGKLLSVKGQIVYDSIDSEGKGLRITVVNKTKFWVLVNNSKGTDRSMNNVDTGGAGSVGYYVMLNDTCKHYMTKLKELKEQL